MTSTPISVRPLRKTPTIVAPISVPITRAAPTEEARAAEHDRRDAVEVLGRLAGIRVAELGAGDQQHRSDPVRQARDHVDAEQDAAGLDAGEARGLRVVAHRVDVPAPGGLVERVPGNRVEDEHQHDAVGEVGTPELERAAEEEQFARERREREVVRDDVRQGERDIQRAEGDDERG